MGFAATYAGETQTLGKNAGKKVADTQRKKSDYKKAMIFSKKRVDVPGSERTIPPRCERIGEVDSSSLISVTVVLRRMGDRRLLQAGSIERLSRAEFAKKMGADPKDVKAVEQFAHEHHLSVVEASLDKCRVVLRGTAAECQ